jgi:hypothetical protein
MILDVIMGFELALLLGFILAGLILNITLVADFIFISTSEISGGPRPGMVTSGYLANALRACVGVLNKLTAILFGGLATRLIID